MVTATLDYETITTKANNSLVRLRPLHDRMDRHIKLYLLENPYPAEEGYAHYGSNKPYTFAQKVIDLLSRADLSLNIEIDLQDKEGDKKAQTVENFVRWCLYQADEKLVNLHQAPLQGSLAFDSVVKGWVSVYVLVSKEEKPNEKGERETTVDIVPFDPRHVLYGKNAKGLAWIGHIRFAYRDEIEEEFGKPLEGQTDEHQLAVLDYWDEQNNYVFLVGTEKDSQQKIAIEKELFSQKHYKKHLPILLLPVPITPPINIPGLTDSIKYQGESVYAPLEELIKTDNMLTSWRLDMVNLGRKQPSLIKSPDGRMTLEKDPFRAGANISIPNDSSIEPLLQKVMPPDTEPLRVKIEQEIEQGSLPSMAYGEIRYDLSGTALAQLGQSIASVIGPRLQVMERAYKFIAHELTEQFGEGGYNPVTISGHDRTGNFQGGLEVSPQDIKGAWFFNVSLKAQVAADKMMDAELATTYKALGFSDEAIAEDVLKVKNTRMEINKRLEQAATAMFPAIGLQKMSQALAERGDMAGSRLVFQEWLKAMQQVFQQQMQGQTGSPQGQMPVGQAPQPGMQPGPMDIAASQLGQ